MTLLNLGWPIATGVAIGFLLWSFRITGRAIDQLEEARRELASYSTNSTKGEVMSLPENPPNEPILQFFAYAHLPDELAKVSKPFNELALAIVNTLPRNPERTVALRKLLEAKDAAVRARIAK